MSPSRELISFDGKYLAADQGDGNFVVYRRSDMKPLWDKWSYEAQQITPPSSPPIIIPDIPDPLPYLGPSAPVMIAVDINPNGMAYWRTINNHRGRPDLKVVISVADKLKILTVNKMTMNVIDIKHIEVHHTGEGVYFSYVNPNILYIPQGNTLWRYDIESGHKDPIWQVGENNLWQCHSSQDDMVHSATIKNRDYQPIFWSTYDLRGLETTYGFKGRPDECQVDKSGKYLIIQESNTNRIIDIKTGTERLISDEAGAVAHMDVGYEYMVGEDNYVGGLVYWDLNTLEKKILYGPNVWNMGYVSCQNNQCLLSLPDGKMLLVDLNGMYKHVAFAPTENQNYHNRVKANLCPLAEYAMWTARIGGTMNAYLVRL